MTVRGHRVIGSPGYPVDEAWLREVGRRMLERRGIDPGAARRQGAAILAAGDRRPALAHLDVRTLVLHGAEDPASGLKAAGLSQQPSPEPSW